MLHACVLSPPSLSLSSWSSPQLDPSQIRLIVYQDCERRGRNVLFDSSAKKRSAEEAPASVSDTLMRDMGGGVSILSGEGVL